MKTFIGTGVGQPEAAVHQAVQGPVSYTHLTLPTT